MASICKWWLYQCRIIISKMCFYYKLGIMCALKSGPESLTATRMCWYEVIFQSPSIFTAAPTSKSLSTGDSVVMKIAFIAAVFSLTNVSDASRWTRPLPESRRCALITSHRTTRMNSFLLLIQSQQEIQALDNKVVGLMYSQILAICCLDCIFLWEVLLKKCTSRKNALRNLLLLFQTATKT